jgi:hypothetical protein
MSGLRQQDWHAIVAIAAAVVALVLHLFHIIEEDAVLAIILVVLALLLFDNIRQSAWQDGVTASLHGVADNVSHLRALSLPPDAMLVGPRDLRAASESFARQARGEMTWFNVCLLMFRPQSLFDTLLRPAVENPAVTSIQFVLDEGERDHWRDHVLPKLASCSGREKVAEPQWRSLQEAVSFILCESSSSGKTEAHLSFWGEPFMARGGGRDVPRYIFHVQPGSELLPQLVELDRRYRYSS